jgi:hypothetical protein
MRQRNHRPAAEGERGGPELMRTKIGIELPLCLYYAVALCALSTFGGQAQQPAPKMTFLDDGEVRIGMDLALGGAVTFNLQQRSSGQHYQQRGSRTADPDVSLLWPVAFRSWG